ncbi:MAG: hypothetical protein KGH89_08750 [Thaumarchaeota archaeon]|nr:hypothetical protein [Nitrososphaerota archaeon]MDE1867335.1 hypothetical protein [Nitrososphaerota archaeon]
MSLEGLSHKFTIVGTMIAICLFVIAVIEVYHFNELVDETQKSTSDLDHLINKTDNVLTEMQKSTMSLTVLVNKTDQLIKAQNSTASNISQQTIMKEYSDETPFKVGISYCNYEANDNDIAYSIIILDKNGDPTTLKFMLIRFFGYYTLPTDNAVRTAVAKNTLEYNTNPELVDPSDEKLHRLQLLPALNQTKNSNDTYLFIRSEYYSAPYSEATGNLITKYTYDPVGQQMIEFKKNTSGNWELYQTPNSVCK